MTRYIPKIAVDFVARFEGCELTAYRDIVGVLTVGYGSTGPHVTPGLTITTAKAKFLLKDDLKIAADRITARIGLVANDLTEHQYAALLSFVFNLGANPSWTIWKVLKARQFDQVPPQLLRFVNAGGKRVQGLVNRRTAEVALWGTTDDDAPQLPSSATRLMATPPTPTDTKPLLTSKSFMTAGATTVATAAAAVGQVSETINPFAGSSELVGRIVAALATLAAALAIATLVFSWLKKQKARL